ncbi:hypothetical protein M2447_001914 [Ereboglobus sp. PH5-10]|nr:hypothetical protein [Ereboglobus sp. PH5-10]
MTVMAQIFGRAPYIIRLTGSKANPILIPPKKDHRVRLKYPAQRELALRTEKINRP